jgi:3-hydroxyisobutyrate dehydrogenase-like beta-hydroxyacid dehydrogenase
VLAAARVPVTGWNRSPLTAPEGVALVRSPADAAAADVVLLMLSDSAATGAVLEQLEPHLRPDTIVLDMGSSDPADSRVRAARLAERGVGWVDAPVSGGPDGAAKGTLAIMVGGEEPHVDRVRPLLDVLGGNVARVGGPGAGHAMKVVNQVIVGLSIDAVAEALALAASLGFGAEEVQAALRGGSADTDQLRRMGTRMGRREYAPGAKLATVRKDLAMAERLAGAAGLELPHLRQALTACDEVVAAGAGDEDCAIVYELRAADGRLRGRRS